MTTVRIIKERLTYIFESAIVYFCFDYFVFKTSFLKCFSFVGFKSFLPVTLGLNFGPYGVIGELIAVTVKMFLTRQVFEFYIMECLIVIILGLGSWILWHVQSYTHRIRFRYLYSYIRYVLMIVFLSLICAYIGTKLINEIAFNDIFIWNVAMSILVGIPIDIIFCGLMNLDPILPPVTVHGKRIELVDDIRHALDNNPESLATFNEKIEELLMKEKVDMKRMFEIQNVVEELYLRIIRKYPNIVIDAKVNYDITFSLECLFIQRKYNPFILHEDEDKLDLAGLTIIKHRALLARYKYNTGLNKVHIVV